MARRQPKREELTPIEAASQPLGIVYFLRFGTRIKIGWTRTWVRSRMHTIPHDEVLGIICGGRHNEAQLHRHFARYNVAGEWFEDCEEIRRYVERYCRPPSLGQTERGRKKQFWNEGLETRRMQDRKALYP